MTDFSKELILLDDAFIRINSRYEARMTELERRLENLEKMAKCTSLEVRADAFRDLVEKNIGKWEVYYVSNTNGSASKMFKCSKCEAVYPNAYNTHDFKYCPNCGARMESIEG